MIASTSSSVIPEDEKAVLSSSIDPLIFWTELASIVSALALSKSLIVVAVIIDSFKEIITSFSPVIPEDEKVVLISAIDPLIFWTELASISPFVSSSRVFRSEAVINKLLILEVVPAILKTRTWPLLFPFPSFPVAPMAMVEPSLERLTELPE